MQIMHAPRTLILSSNTPSKSSTVPNNPRVPQRLLGCQPLPTIRQQTLHKISRLVALRRPLQPRKLELTLQYRLGDLIISAVEGWVAT